MIEMSLVDVSFTSDLQPLSLLHRFSVGVQAETLGDDTASFSG